jgi:hypothetical protein
MPRSRLSIGVEDATGQPANAPRGPYITDEDDGTSPRRKRHAPNDAGARAAASRTKVPSRDKDLASRRKGPAQP